MAFGENAAFTIVANAAGTAVILHTTSTSTNTVYITAMKGTIIWLTLAIRFTPPISTAATQNASTSEAMITDHEYSPRNGKTFTVCWFLGSKKLFTALDIPFT